MVTEAPSSQRAVAMARPRWVAPPVTMAAFPVMSNISVTVGI